jgi:hypothetical protein
MDDTNTTIQRLLEGNALRGALIASIVQALNFPKGSHGLDAGCGIGRFHPGPTGLLCVFHIHVVY